MIKALQGDADGGILYLTSLLCSLQNRQECTFEDAIEMNRVLSITSETVSNMQSKTDQTIKDKFESFRADYGPRINRVEKFATETNRRSEILTSSLHETKETVSHQGKLIESLTERLGAAEAETAREKEKLRRAVLLQGDLLHRMADLEDKQADLVKLVGRVAVEATERAKMGEENRKELQRLSVGLKDGTDFLDTQVLELRATTRTCSKQVEELTDHHQQMDRLVNGLERRVTRKLDEADQALAERLPGDPSPAQLLALYLEYERKVECSRAVGQ